MDSGSPAVGLLAGLMLATSTHARPQAPPAPAFTRTDTAGWLNSAPLAWSDLRGTVTLVEFWTFDCANCYRTIPWLKTLEPRYRARGFRVVGIHTPEFAHERVRANVVEKLSELGVGYPVMLDDDYAFWSAFENKYWPAFYLVDRQGRVRSHWVGETHAREHNAVAMEAAIEALLAEP